MSQDDSMLTKEKLQFKDLSIKLSCILSYISEIDLKIDKKVAIQFFTDVNQFILQVETDINEKIKYINKKKKNLQLQSSDQVKLNKTTMNYNDNDNQFMKDILIYKQRVSNKSIEEDLINKYQQINLLQQKIKNQISSDKCLNSRQPNNQSEIELQLESQSNNYENSSVNILGEQQSIQQSKNQNKVTKQLIWVYSKIEIKQRNCFRNKYILLENKKYKCSECQMMFSNSSVFSRHWIMKHKTDSYDCVNCIQKFYCLTDLALHDYIDHNMIGCDFCISVIKKKEYYKRHLVYKHPAQVRNLVLEYKNKQENGNKYQNEIIEYEGLNGLKKLSKQQDDT